MHFRNLHCSEHFAELVRTSDMIHYHIVVSHLFRGWLLTSLNERVSFKYIHLRTLGYFLCLGIWICASKLYFPLLATDMKVLLIIHSVSYSFLPALKQGNYVWSSLLNLHFLAYSQQKTTEIYIYLCTLRKHKHKFVKKVENHTFNYNTKLAICRQKCSVITWLISVC